MSRRSFLVAVGFVALLTLSAGTALWLLLHYEPRHYRRAAVPPGEHRQQLSKDCFTELLNLVNDDREGGWAVRVTDEQVNSFLSEDFVRSRLADRLLPEGLHEPRVRFDPEGLRVSFRSRGRLLSPVVSIRLRVWLPAAEKNALALRLEELKAGLVPFSAQWLLERISEVARQHGIEVSWYRHAGAPVALLRFQADRPRPSLHLLAVQLGDGILHIRGRSQEPRAARPRLGFHLAAARR